MTSNNVDRTAQLKTEHRVVLLDVERLWGSATAASRLELTRTALEAAGALILLGGPEPRLPGPLVAGIPEALKDINPLYLSDITMEVEAEMRALRACTTPPDQLAVTAERVKAAFSYRTYIELLLMAAHMYGHRTDLDDLASAIVSFDSLGADAQDLDPVRADLVEAAEWVPEEHHDMLWWWFGPPPKEGAM